MVPKSEFLKIIEKQRREKSDKKFEGSFLDYLEIVKEDKSIVKLSHKRLYEVIANQGIGAISETDPRFNKIFDAEKIKTYDGN